MKPWLAVLLLTGTCHAQVSLTNFSTPVQTTQPYAQAPGGSCSAQLGAVQTIAPSTPTSGSATIVTTTAISGGTCTGTPFSIFYTNTDWDGTGYVATSLGGTVPQTSVFNATQTDAYDSHAQPNGDYAGNSSSVVDSSGKIWTFYKSCSNAEVSFACVAVKTSTNGGTTWTKQVALFTDPGSSCGSGTVGCDYRNVELGYVGGNLTLAYSIHDPVTSAWLGVYAPYCNPTAVDCTVTANWNNNTLITLVPAGEPGGFFFCTQYGNMVNLPGGALGYTVTGINTGVCDGDNYMLVSCDNGHTYGTGTGCVGLMAGYAANTVRFIHTASGGYVTDPPTDENTFAYIGGTTVIGLSRNNQWTSGCSAPCGPLIQWVSSDLGVTWTNAVTNIGAYAPPSGLSILHYTEVSPVFFNPNLGGLWMVTWGDRVQDSASANTSRVYAAFINPSAAAVAPTTYPASPTQVAIQLGLVLGGYPSVVPTGTPNQLLFQFDTGGPRGTQVLALSQSTANLAIANAFVTKGKIMKGVTVQ